MSDGIPSKMGFISSPGATIFPLSSSLDVGMFTRPKPNCVFVRETVFTCLIVEDEDNDPVATYRLTEFEVLTDIHEPNRKSKGLEFNEIIIPNSLQPYFKTINQRNIFLIFS